MVVCIAGSSEEGSEYNKSETREKSQAAMSVVFNHDSLHLEREVSVNVAGPSSLPASKAHCFWNRLCTE
jgi:hypothetical protein